MVNKGNRTTTLSDPVIVRFSDMIATFRDEIPICYLFGSRARSDWRPDSDYDILVVMYKKNRDIIDKLYDLVMDILLEKGRLVSLKIFSYEEFKRLSSIPTPFMERVLKEGIRLG